MAALPTLRPDSLVDPVRAKLTALLLVAPHLSDLARELDFPAMAALPTLRPDSLVDPVLVTESSQESEKMPSSASTLQLASMRPSEKLSPDQFHCGLEASATSSF